MMISFIKTLDLALTPILILFGLGLFLLWRGSRRAKFFLTIAFCFLLLFSNRLPVHWALSKMEGKYPPLLSSNQVPAAERIHYIVVLGAVPSPNPNRSIASQAGGILLTRVAEGIRLMREFPAARLVLSGGKYQATSDAKMMERVAISLGVASNRLILEDQSSSTYEEAIYLKNLLGDDPFILVTSARHMPRAMGIFKKEGLSPIAAPTDYQSSVSDWAAIASYNPRSGFISSYSGLLYEYLGILKAKFTGQL